VKFSRSSQTTTYHLSQLKELRLASKGTLSKKQLEGITIGTINLEAVPFNEALDALKILVDQANGENGIAPNLVIRDPSKKIFNKEVTISLSQIPAEVALKYMLDLVGGRVEYGEHIISIIPR